MHAPRALASAALLLAAARADAGQVLTFSEEGTRDGKAYRSTLVLSVAPEGVRAEATDLSSPGSPKAVNYLYVAKEDRILPVDPPTGPVISRATLAVVEERARASGHRRSPGSFSVTPLHSRQSSGAWTCEAWAVRRPGQATEIVCLADPGALGVDEVTRANLRKMNALFVPFANAVRLALGDTREGFDAYALAGGFPVHTSRSKEGAVEADIRLVSVENAALPPDLFRATAPAAPAPESAPKTPAGAGETAGRSLSLAAWAARGMPDAGRVWTGADYDAAAGLLEAAAREDAARLPREGGADSGALYRRFVDPANLAPVRGPGPADERARAGAGILAGADRISLLYAYAYRDDARLGPELAGLMAYTLLAAREVVPLADAAVAAAPKGDTHHALRLASRRRTHEALASVVNATLASLATRGGFRPAERLRLARALAEHLPALAAYLPEASRRELPVRLKGMAAAETDPAVRDSLDRARAALLQRAKAA